MCTKYVQLRERHGGMRQNDAIDELRNAFDLIERTSPGISDEFVRQLTYRVCGTNYNESQMQAAFSR